MSGMQQQMAQQHEQIGQQAISQQMVLCPVRFVYETQILVQPGDQIQPNQTFFINPQNPPPWMQNSLQSRQAVSASPVVYVQQLPNNIVSSVQQHMDQNQLYLPQNFGNFIQQQMLAPQDMRPSMQLANIVPNMVQNIQPHVVNDNRTVNQNNQMQNQILQNQIVSRPLQSPMVNQVDQRQVYMRPQMQQTNIIRPMMNPMQNVQQQNLPVPNVVQNNTGQTFVPNLGRPPNAAKTPIPNVVNVQPVVPKVRELSPADANKTSSSPIGNVVPSVRSFVPNYYRPIQPRPQMTQNQNVGQNIANTPKAQQHIPVQTLQNTPVYNHDKQQSSNSNSAIIQQLNAPLRKRKSESPEDIHRKMTLKPNYNQQGVAKPNFNQQAVTVTKLVNEIGTNTSPIHRPKLNPQLQINPQPMNKNIDENNKETNLQDKDKLVRNTVFTQARVGRVLQDKVDEPIVQNVATELKVEKCEVQMQTDDEIKHKPDNIRLVQEYTKYVNNLPDNARNTDGNNVQTNVNMQQNVANMHQKTMLQSATNMQGHFLNVQRNPANYQAYASNQQQNATNMQQNVQIQGGVNVQNHFTNNQQSTSNQQHSVQPNATHLQQVAASAQQMSTSVHHNASQTQSYVPNAPQNPINVQQNISNVQGYPNMQLNAINMLQSATNIQQSSTDVQQNATNIQQDAFNMQQNTTNMPLNASIEQRTANIHPYAINVQNNDQNMQQNAANVQQNAANVQQNAANVQQNVANVRQNIAVSQNASNYQQNTTDIEEQKNMQQTTTVSQNASNNQQATEVPKTQNTASVQANIKTESKNVAVETNTEKPKTNSENTKTTKANVKIQDSEFKKPKNVEPKAEKVFEKVKIVEKDDETTKVVEDNKEIEVKEEQRVENEKITIKQENINILTHVVDGYVIQESNFAFPIRKPLKEKTIPSNMKSISQETRDLIRESIKEELKSNLDIPLLPFHYLLLESAKEEKEKAEAMEIADQKEKNNPFAELEHPTVKSWTVEDLTTHLLEFNWKETVSLLQEHEIDGESLYLVSKPQLLTIGVSEEHADVICDFVKS